MDRAEEDLTRLAARPDWGLVVEGGSFRLADGLDGIWANMVPYI